MCGLVAITVASRSSGRRRANSSVVVPPLMAITSPGRDQAHRGLGDGRLGGDVVGQALDERVGPRRAGRQRAAVDAAQQPGVGELLQIAADGVERHAQPQRQVRGADLALGAQPAQDELTALLAEQLPRGVGGGHAGRIAQKAARSRTRRKPARWQPLRAVTRGRRPRPARPPPRCPAADGPPGSSRSRASCAGRSAPPPPRRRGRPTPRRPRSRSTPGSGPRR